ncbi:MAG: hypothetical protein ABSA83_16080 [Verrucomicrobiota bacterium]
MKTKELFSDVVTVAPNRAAYELNIVGVYQDPLTQSWGVPMCRLAMQLAGEDRIRNTWYDVHSLADIDIFLDAIRAALMADVIVISVYAAEELPMDLYVWIDAWLPRRPPGEGALTALIGVVDPQSPQSLHTQEYLQAVARKAQLDFIPLFQTPSLEKV